MYCNDVCLLGEPQFYKRLTEINRKTQELKAQRLELESQKRKTTLHGVSGNSIRNRVEYAIKHLAEAPKEKHREIFENVLQFVEIHPTKIKMGIYGGHPVEGSTTIKNGGHEWVTL